MIPLPSQPSAIVVMQRPGEHLASLFRHRSKTVPEKHVELGHDTSMSSESESEEGVDPNYENDDKEASIEVNTVVYN